VSLLALLERERGRIVSRRRLLVEVWGLQHVDGLETRTVDVHIAKLRKKIGAGEREPIETVRGEGYRFVG
jgi:two-component system response regulator RegX3